MTTSNDLVERLKTVLEGMEAGLDDWPLASHIWEYKAAIAEIESLRAELAKDVKSFVENRNETTLNNLYRLWNHLGPCPLLGFVGSVIQDYQHLQDELKKETEYSATCGQLKDVTKELLELVWLLRDSAYDRSYDLGEQVDEAMANARAIGIDA